MADILRKQGRNIGSSGGSGGGGLTEEEHDALMSIASMPARGDYNPEKADINPVLYSVHSASENNIARVPVIGYDKISIKWINGNASYVNKYITFYDAGGNELNSQSLSDTSNVWSDYISIPENAVCGYLSFYNAGTMYASMLTKDSPYNPDNQ